MVRNLLYGKRIISAALARDSHLRRIALCDRSRTPLVAMVAAVAWLAALSANQKSGCRVGAIFFLGIAGFELCA